MFWLALPVEKKHIVPLPLRPKVVTKSSAARAVPESGAPAPGVRLHVITSAPRAGGAGNPAIGLTGSKPAIQTYWSATSMSMYGEAAGKAHHLYVRRAAGEAKARTRDGRRVVGHRRRYAGHAGAVTVPGGVVVGDHVVEVERRQYLRLTAADGALKVGVRRRAGRLLDAGVPDSEQDVGIAEGVESGVLEALPGVLNADQLAVPQARPQRIGRRDRVELGRNDQAWLGPFDVVARCDLLDAVE